MSWLNNILFGDLNEAGLGGMSRSSGKPSWNTYVVPTFTEGYTLAIENDSALLSAPSNSASTITPLEKWQEVELLSVALQTDRSSRFALIRTKEGDEGWININNLRKPSARGAQSKEYTPSKLGFDGKELSNSEEFLNVTKRGWSKERYADDQTFELVLDSLKSVSEAPYTGSTRIPFSETHDVGSRNFMILSKNFGEVLAALYLLSNPEVVSVSFPDDISQMLYDFSASKTDSVHFYSVKSFGGSATSIDNLKFILDNLSADELDLEGYETEYSDIKLLMKSFTEERIRTVDVIERAFLRMFPDVAEELAQGLREASERFLGLTLQESSNGLLTQRGLSRWLGEFQSTWNELLPDEREELVNELTVFIQNLTANVLEGRTSTFETTKAVLLSPKQQTTQHGYLTFPMGSFIIKRLNESPRHLEVLNRIANAANVTQVTVRLFPDSVGIDLARFSDGDFRFAYNAGTKYPSNRPLGFKKV
jgi:hypothetical protein